MRAFVTGATGFIGRHLVHRLAAEGHQVVCLVRKHKAQADRRNVLDGLQVELVEGDVNDREVLVQGMSGCDWLFHLANLYSMWEPSPDRFEEINIQGTRSVLESALQAGVKKVVYISTVAVYGRPAEAPFTEQVQPGPVLFSEYARTKASANQIAWDMYEQKGLPLVVLYPGIVLGPGDDKASGHYIQDIIRRHVPTTIFHNSLATYVPVWDVATALLRAAENPESTGQKYLIGKHMLDGRAFARLISEVSGVPLPLLHFPDWLVMAAAYLLTGISAITRRAPLWGLSIDAAHTLKNGFWLDGSKAERELGIRYSPLREALIEAIAFYRQQWARQKR